MLMTDNIILDALKKFLLENVSGKIKLQKPTEVSGKYELVNPSVHIGWIPPKLPENMNLQDQVQDIPCIVVGMDDGQDDGSDASLSIRLSFVTFSSGTIKDNKLHPNFDGYKDLVNLITLTRMQLAEATVIGGTTVLQHPLKWGMYQDQPYPYWHGWLTFPVSCAVMEYIPGITNQYK